jgi:DNA-binding MarR family transcriptional regulator
VQEQHEHRPITETLELARLLVRSGKLTETKLDGHLDGRCLSATRLVALLHIAQTDQSEQMLSLSQLAIRLASVKSNVTQLVDRLEADQLVRRVHDATDRRSIQVELTDVGRQECDQAIEALRPLEESLNEVYTPDEMRQLTMLLQKLNKVWSN